MCKTLYEAHVWLSINREACEILKVMAVKACERFILMMMSLQHYTGYSEETLAPVMLEKVTEQCKVKHLV